MQGIEHINLTNSPKFAKQVGATTAKAIEVKANLTPEQKFKFDCTGLFPADVNAGLENQGFDVFAVACAVRALED